MRCHKHLTSAVKVERQYNHSLEIHLISYKRRIIKLKDNVVVHWMCTYHEYSQMGT